MKLPIFRRQELLEPALAHIGLSPIHQSGPARGKPLSARRLSRVIGRFITEQKQKGRMIERRPVFHIGSNSPPRRMAQFVIVPHTIDMFSDLAKQECAEDHAVRPAT